MKQFSQPQAFQAGFHCRFALIAFTGSVNGECDEEADGTYMLGFARVGRADILEGIKRETEGADIWDSNCEVVDVEKSPSAIFVATVLWTTTAMPTTTISSSAGQTTTTMSPTSGQTTTDADHDQATNGFGSKILKVFKLSGYLQ